MTMKKTQFAGIVIAAFGMLAMTQLNFNFNSLTIQAVIAAIVFISGFYLFAKDL